MTSKYYHPVKTDGLPLSKDQAVWQYLLDHSKPTPAGHCVKVYLKSRSHFESKIRSRMKGVSRADERLEEQELEKVIQASLYDKKLRDKFSKSVSLIDKEGSWLDKLALLIYRKCRNHILAKTPNDSGK
jgi:hypothetical protein